jgi:FkbM family methyltransferase
VRCYAVELVPDNFAALQTNIQLNGLSDLITAFNIGLGDQPKLIDYQVEGHLKPGEGSGTANVLPPGHISSEPRVEATIETLDQLSSQMVGRCSIIKIDVDGYDLKVLQGARTFLATHRPIILGEFNGHCMGWHGQSRRDLIGFCAEAKYEAFTKAATNEFVPGISDDDSDVLLLPSK